MRQRHWGPLTTSVAGHAVDGIERAVGLTVSPHSLRHHFGASLVSRGVSVVAVSRWLGHSSPETTYRGYAHLKPGDELARRAATAETLSTTPLTCTPPCTREPSS